MDTVSYLWKKPDKSLYMEERYNKCKYLDSCLQQRYQFPPFVAPFDGLMGTGLEAVLKRLASRLAIKWKQPHSQSCGYVRNRVAVTMV